MQPNDSFLNKYTGSGRKLLGELELPIGAKADETIIAWLTELLSPLNLHADFLNKVLKSAQNSAAHILLTESAAKFEHVHLIIFVPSDPISKEQTWGFFRIEKIESTKTDENSPDPQTDFASFADYVTTSEFLMSQLVNTLTALRLSPLELIGV